MESNVGKNDRFWCDATRLNDYLCPYRYWMRHIRGHVPRAASIDLEFGIAVHRGLQTLWAGESIEQAVERAQMGFIEVEGDHRTRAKIAFLLSNYREFYPTDSEDWVMLANEHPFRFALDDDIDWAGRLDKILMHKRSGNVYVLDHKTTSRYGDRFWDSFYPSWQLTGYVWAARQLFATADVQSMVFVDVLIPWINADNPRVKKNGEPYANEKTWRDCYKREPVETVGAESMPELLDTLYKIKQMHDYYAAVSDPQPPPHCYSAATCGMYSGCAYRGICRQPECADDLIKHSFKQEFWSPFNHQENGEQ